MFVHPSEFYSLVTNRLTKALLRSDRVYGGYYYDQKVGTGRVSPVTRDPRNKHYLSPKEFSNSSFAPYAGGPLYFMSRAVAGYNNYYNNYNYYYFYLLLLLLLLLYYHYYYYYYYYYYYIIMIIIIIIIIIINTNIIIISL